MKTYGFAEQKYIDIMNNLISTKEEFELIRACNLRISLITVEKEEKGGIIVPSMKGLPYRVKFNNIKDRIVSNKDVIFFLDKYYLDRCLTEPEWEALMYSLLNCIDFALDKDFVPKVDTDGRCKLKQKETDMEFAGYSINCEKYGSDSPELKQYNQLISEYCDSLHGGTTLD